MQPLGSIAAVVAAIGEDAAIEAERIAREAEHACSQMGPDEPALPPGEREAKLAAARRAAREKLAAEDALDTRVALETREAWIQEVVEHARRRLDEPDRRARLAAVVQKAAACLPAGPLVVTVAPVDLALVEGAVSDPRMTPGGVRVATADGRLSIDETVEARARRCEPEWRAALGRLWG